MLTRRCCIAPAGVSLRLYSNRERPFHLGPLALERLHRAPSPVVATGEFPRDERLPGEQAVARVIPEYIRLFGRYLDGSPAKAEAPVPVDPALRADNLKAHAYFLDAALVGCCQIQPGDWATVDNPGHRYACVFVVEFGREPKAVPECPHVGQADNGTPSNGDLLAAAVEAGAVQRVQIVHRREIFRRDIVCSIHGRVLGMCC